MKKGRKKTMDYSPEEFNKLSTEERRLRGRLSRLKRMIKKREDEIDELMKPINKLNTEIVKYKNEMEELKNSIKDMGFDFPTFRVEGFDIKKGKDENGDDKYHSYFRGVWYVNGKKKQKYLGSEEKVFSLVRKKYRGFDKLMGTDKTDKIKEYFTPQFQLDFWNKEYEDFSKKI